MNRDWQKRFDEAFKTWAERPPQTPASQAAARVVARLERRRSRPAFATSGFRLATVAAALVLVIAAVWVLLRATPPSLGEIVIPPLEEHVVLLWLDQDTPLYLTVAPPATEGDL